MVKYETSLKESTSVCITLKRLNLILHNNVNLKLGLFNFKGA